MASPESLAPVELAHRQPHRSNRPPTSYHKSDKAYRIGGKPSPLHLGCVGMRRLGNWRLAENDTRLVGWPCLSAVLSATVTGYRLFLSAVKAGVKLPDFLSAMEVLFPFPFWSERRHFISDQVGAPPLSAFLFEGQADDFLHIVLRVAELSRLRLSVLSGQRRELLHGK